MKQKTSEDARRDSSGWKPRCKARRIGYAALPFCDRARKGHSTLTFDYRAALDRGVDTRERVLQHLRTQLLASNESAS